MDQVLFVGKIDGTQKDKYIKYHKEMSAQFLKEKKALIVGDWAVPDKVFNFEEQLKNVLNQEI